ncbi:hypothetical protein JTB14_029636 [Gonioctena quinquepunctata]|nr:hypothetical protein JTB14_029636 [Gonioctena quinquepunctata]
MSRGKKILDLLQKPSCGLDIAPETESQINRGESKKIIKVLQDIDLNSPMLDTLFSKQSISESTKADDQKLYGKNENDDEANGYYSDEEPFSPDYLDLTRKMIQVK